MSTKLKDNKYYIPVSVRSKSVSVMISQIRVFSTKRMWNKLAELDTGDFNKVLEEISKFLFCPPHRSREVVANANLRLLYSLLRGFVK